MRADNKAFANKVASLKLFIFSLQKSIKHLSLLLIFRQTAFSKRLKQSSKTLPESAITKLYLMKIYDAKATTY
jgi:hypothetical protein